MNKATLLLIASLFFLTACNTSSDSSEQPVTPSAPQDSGKAGTDSGPFTVQLDSNGNYKHTLDIPINQNEGKLEYIFKFSQQESFKVTNYGFTVQGCTASNVSHRVFWIPDTRKPNTGNEVFIGNEIKIEANTEANLVHVFRNLGGCSRIQVYIEVKRNPTAKPLPKCADNAITSDCGVVIYCKEEDPLSYFVETEIRLNSGKLSITKFMNSPNQPRSLTMMTDVQEKQTTTTRTFTSTTNLSANLVIDLKTNKGSLSEVIQGNSFVTKLNCQAN